MYNYLRCSAFAVVAHICVIFSVLSSSINVETFITHPPRFSPSHLGLRRRQQHPVAPAAVAADAQVQAQRRGLHRAAHGAGHEEDPVGHLVGLNEARRGGAVEQQADDPVAARSGRDEGRLDVARADGVDADAPCRVVDAVGLGEADDGWGESRTRQRFTSDKGGEESRAWARTYRAWLRRRQSGRAGSWARADRTEKPC